MTVEGRLARVAELDAAGESVKAIADAIGRTERTAFRMLKKVRAGAGTQATDGEPERELRALPTPEPVRVEPFEEVARAFAAQRQVEDECRRLATHGRQEAVRLGALKTLATVSLARLDMLDRIGALPRGPAWLHELRFDAAWSALCEVAEAAGVDADELAELTRRRVQERIDLEERGALEMAPLAPLPRRRVAA